LLKSTQLKPIIRIPFARLGILWDLLQQLHSASNFGIDPPDGVVRKQLEPKLSKMPKWKIIKNILFYSLEENWKHNFVKMCQRAKGPKGPKGQWTKGPMDLWGQGPKGQGPMGQMALRVSSYGRNTF
jgi:hypothetical protein